MLAPFPIAALISPAAKPNLVMKLLVLAQVPPPLHGQSMMVQTAVEGLPEFGVTLHHVNLCLSRDHADIGVWRLGKVLAIITACVRVVWTRITKGPDTLYYVPAPGKRGALYRDWLVMLCCRPWFERLVLHLHNGGLAIWLAQQATRPERWLTSLFLGRADTAIILTAAQTADAAALQPRRIAIVPNGIADPCPEWKHVPRPTVSPQILFLGLCSEEKGLFDLIEAVLCLNAEGGRKCRLVAAGAFPNEQTRVRFHSIAADHADAITHVGFAETSLKRRLLENSTCLAFPTRYSHEAQPLVLLEALAHDLPIVATDWRGIAETLPRLGSMLIKPGDVPGLVQALRLQLEAAGAPGCLRKHYLAHFTRPVHLASLAAVLRDT